ncbi:MAG: HD domain-containing protein [bacterium]
MANLAKAIAIAAQAHQSQKDKSGFPYILHPIRVMMRMRSDVDMIVAILHDVVEDTDWTLEQLRAEGFSEEVLQAVSCLTHQENESYDKFLARIESNAIARRVKLADLEDNMDVRRLNALTEKDIQRLQRYHPAWVKLSQADEKV